MNWKNLLVESFIRGVGKTSAALVLCGVVGGVVTGVWTIYNYQFDNNNQTENENEFVDSEVVENDESHNKYKIILDTLY